jgi:hypothetical protein
VDFDTTVNAMAHATPEMNLGTRRRPGGSRSPPHTADGDDHDAVADHRRVLLYQYIMRSVPVVMMPELSPVWASAQRRRPLVGLLRGCSPFSLVAEWR